jgi:hypothetical protein
MAGDDDELYARELEERGLGKKIANTAKIVGNKVVKTGKKAINTANQRGYGQVAENLAGDALELALREEDDKLRREDDEELFTRELEERGFFDGAKKVFNSVKNSGFGGAAKSLGEKVASKGAEKVAGKVAGKVAEGALLAVLRRYDELDAREYDGDVFVYVLVSLTFLGCLLTLDSCTPGESTLSMNSTKWIDLIIDC